MIEQSLDAAAHRSAVWARALAALWSVFWLAAAVALTCGIQPQNRSETVGGPSALVRGVLAGKDTLTHDYPAAWWGWRQVRRTGQFPLWNPCWFTGEPFIASQTFLPFYPPNWLMAALPLPLGFNLQYPLHLWLAALVMGWTCRQRGLGWWAAGLAGLAWGFGGHLATLAGPGHIQKLQALAWLPLVVYGMGELGGRRPGCGIPAAGMGLALQALAGHPQVIYMSLIAGGLDLVVRLLAGGGWNLRRRQRLRLREEPATPGAPDQPGDLHSAFHVPHSAFVKRLGASTMALLLALFLSGAMWVPTAEFARQSNRQGALSWTDAVRGSLPPEEILEFAAPRLRGDSMVHGRGAYAGRYGESPTSAPERIVSDYMGMATLLLALLGLTLPGRRPAAAGWLSLAGLGLTLSVGGYLDELTHVETYAFLLRVVPGLAHFRAPSAMMALTALGLTMAAALGAQGLAELGLLPASERARRATRAAGTAIIALMLAMVLRLIASGDVLATGAHWERLGHRPVTAAEAVLALRGVALLHTSVFLAASAALMGGIALALRRAEGPARRRIAGTLAALLGMVLAADLLLNDRPFWSAADARPYESYMQSHWAMPQWEADAARLEGPARYLEVGGELRNWALTYTDFDRGRVISSLHGYHPVAYENYFRLLGGLGFTHPNLLKLFAVNWLLWPESEDSAGRRPPPGFIEMGRIPGMRLLHNPQARFVRPAGLLREVPDWQAMLAALREPAHDPNRMTLCLPGEAAADPAAGTTETMKTIECQAWPLGPGEWRIEYRADAAGRIVVSLPAAPGWRAWLRPTGNGQWEPLQVERADGYFMLLGPLPAGPADVRLIYDPVSQRLGIYLTLLGLAWLGWRSGRARTRGLTQAMKSARPRAQAPGA